MRPLVISEPRENNINDDYENMVRELKNRIALRRLMVEHERQSRKQQKEENGENELRMAPYTNDQEDDLASKMPGIYTEGGLMYTRHERLDVKKPGPQPPLHFSSNDIFSEQKSKISQDSKVKKLVHDVTDDHANYSVDSEYAHVILKNLLDDWGEGQRVVQALGEMLNLQNYLTHIRVDRQEVSFKVEANPEKKTAYDVAKSINDGRFKNNLSRRMGVLVLKAGVGDKVKDYDNVYKNTRIEAIDM